MHKLVLSLFLLFSLRASATITLPAIIGSNMVLQQQSEVALWGTAKNNAKVTVTTSWNGRRYTVNAGSDGAWKLKVQTPAAGGPYEITLSDGTPLKLTDILIGEVWVCSGQSNMEMPVKGFKNQPILNSADILMKADNPQIRLFHVPKKISRTPVPSCETAWKASDGATAASFSAVGFQFAQMLQERLKVPVGIIESTWGGTLIEAWMGEPMLQPFATEIKVPAVTDTLNMKPNDPTGLYNGMIAPIRGYGIKGALWYQGESNRLRPAQYEKLLPAMVKGWRNVWDAGDWAFYYVQIAPFTYKDDSGEAGKLREAQLRAESQMPNAGMAVSMDVGEELNIHPPDKTIISKRLLYLALARTYGYKSIPCEGPVYKSMQVSGDTAKLSFDYASNGLTTFGKPLAPLFEVAGADKVFHPAETAVITREGGINVRSSSVKTPAAVRYAFKAWTVGTLYNTEGLPASSFRTDDW
jgi:sialate O-acetylesterase